MEQRVAERRTEPLEQRGLEQERPQPLVALRFEELEAEILGDVPRGAGEAVDCFGRMLRSLCSECGEIDGGGPSLGTPRESVRIHLRRSGAQGGMENGGRLVAVEPERAGTELRNGPAGSA